MALGPAYGKNVSLMADCESKIIDLANKSCFAEYSIGITAVGKHHRISNFW